MYTYWTLPSKLFSTFNSQDLWTYLALDGVYNNSVDLEFILTYIYFFILLWLMFNIIFRMIRMMMMSMMSDVGVHNDNNNNY